MTLLIQETNQMSTQAYYTITSVSPQNDPGQGKPTAHQASLPIFTCTLPPPNYPGLWRRGENVVINEGITNTDTRPVLTFQAWKGWNLHYTLTRGGSTVDDLKSERHICQIVQTSDWRCRTILCADVRDASGGGGGGSSSTGLIGNKGEKKRIIMKGYWTWNWGEKHAGIYLEGGGDDGDDLKIAGITSRGGPSIDQEDNSYEVEIPAKVDYCLVVAMCLIMDDVYRGRQLMNDVKPVDIDPAFWIINYDS